MNITKNHLLPADCAVDLSVGSERGEYVNGDYILRKLGRPHRAVNLMYCYYPLDEGWPVRASIAHARDDVSFAWDYPYDDYFPYQTGNLTGEPFASMRDIRAHGQDVILTLTIDPNVPEKHLIQIARELSVFGRLMLRINHEATGNWFSFNKRCSYKEVADFFVRFHNVIKREAPHIQTILCAGAYDEKTGKIEKEDEFSEAIKNTDYWSIDKYLALNFGWPYSIAEKDGKKHNFHGVDFVYKHAKDSYHRFIEICGVAKPMVLSELNADGDVTGAIAQARAILDFTDKLKADKERWLNGFTYYQFRDRGRLGLEIEDPNNKEVGIEQPVMEVYKQIIHEPFFMPRIENTGRAELPIKMRWGGFEDAEGVALQIDIEREPVFFELYFGDDDLNLMLEINGRWFYKAPNTRFVDLMPAFFGKSQYGLTTLNIFAPPANGENDPAQGADWQVNYYAELKTLPDIRLRYEPIEA